MLPRALSTGFWDSLFSRRREANLHIAVLWVVTPCSLEMGNFEHVQCYQPLVVAPLRSETPWRQKATVESAASLVLGCMSREGAIESLGQIQQSLIVSSASCPLPPRATPGVPSPNSDGCATGGGEGYTAANISPSARQREVGGGKMNPHLDIAYYIITNEAVATEIRQCKYRICCRENSVSEKD
jgi:hypothetical protein